MWLSVRSGSSAGRSLEITHGIVIGRDATCDLAFPDDQKISRRHAYLNRAPDGSVTLQDLGSTNGSFVDAQRITGTVPLSGNEHLRFGDTLVDCSAEPLSTGADPRIGGTVGRYLIKGLIAEGSMGLVYEAEHTRTGRAVALKLMNGKLFGSPRARERFLQESRVAGGIEHPNIIPIYDADEVDGIPYIAMKWIRGEDLNTIIAREGALPLDRAISIVEQVGSALDAAHAHGLVHRDVKPGNILVTSAEDPEGAGRAYLGDFGITKDLTDDRGMTVPGNIVGTRDYMAPEQFMGEPVDARTDVYALGCVLFEALTGVRPYGVTSEVALMRAHLEAPPPEPHRIRPELPEAIDEVVAKALAKRKEDRYLSCGDMTRDARVAFTQPASLEAQTPTSCDAELGPAPTPTILETGGSAAATALEAAEDETAFEVGSATVLENPPGTVAEGSSSEATIMDDAGPGSAVAAGDAALAGVSADGSRGTVADASSPVGHSKSMPATAVSDKKRRLVLIFSGVVAIALLAVAIPILSRGGYSSPSPPPTGPTGPTDTGASGQSDTGATDPEGDMASLRAEVGTSFFDDCSEMPQGEIPLGASVGLFCHVDDVDAHYYYFPSDTAMQDHFDGLVKVSGLSEGGNCRRGKLGYYAWHFTGSEVDEGQILCSRAGGLYFVDSTYWASGIYLYVGPHPSLDTLMNVWLDAPV